MAARREGRNEWRWNGRTTGHVMNDRDVMSDVNTVFYVSSLVVSLLAYSILEEVSFSVSVSVPVSVPVSNCGRPHMSQTATALLF
jgi:hypothetical protein